MKKNSVLAEELPALIAGLSEKLDRVFELLDSPANQGLKHCYTVEELGQRWDLCPEAIRRLIRAKQLKPLRGFRPFRITLDEIKRYEALEEGREARALISGGIDTAMRGRRGARH